MIRYCPNCKGELNQSKKLSQGIKECKTCGGIYFLLETTKPKLNGQTKSDKT